MKITCSCGEILVDQTDYLPYKAHIIPDQHYFGLLEAIDDAIENSGPSPSDKDAAVMRVRNLIGKIKRWAWQCRVCGRLFVDGPPLSNTVYQFVPADGNTPKELLRGREESPGDWH